MPDTINGTGEGQPADDSIRGALAAAIAEQPEPETPALKNGAAAKPGADGVLASGTGEGGDDTGAELDAAKPAADAGKTGDKEPAKVKAATTDDAKPEPVAADKAETDKKTAVAALTGKWSAKDKDAFAKLPPEGQELLLRRHKEMDGAFTKKTQEIAAFRKEFEPVQQVLAPYAEQMKQHGWTPSSLITAWANVEKRLMEGDGVAVVTGLMKGYRVDPSKVVEALGLAPGARTNGAANGGDPPPAPDAPSTAQLAPELTNHLNALLSQALKPIKDRLSTEDQQRAAAASAAMNTAVEKTMSEIEQFKTAQDDRGSVLHPHFEEVEEMMTSLAQAAIAARKPVPPLAQLYETAVMANPDLQKEVIAARVKAQRETETQAARAKAEKAKRASSSVTGAPGSGQAPQGRKVDDMSLREQLEAAAAEAEA